jgi:hypothetical protein
MLTPMLCCSAAVGSGVALQREILVEPRRSFKPTEQILGLHRDPRTRFPELEKPHVFVFQ